MAQTKVGRPYRDMVESRTERDAGRERGDAGTEPDVGRERGNVVLEQDTMAGDPAVAEAAVAVQQKLN